MVTYKTKRSRKPRICKDCEAEINKGDQYGQRSKRVGRAGMASYDGTVHTWEPFYIKVDICAECAGAAH
jgi:hypothetical protein